MVKHRSVYKSARSAAKLWKEDELYERSGIKDEEKEAYKLAKGKKTIQKL